MLTATCFSAAQSYRSICLVSAAVVYHVFDFDQRQSLGKDELVLALECTARALAKISISTNALVQDPNAGDFSRFLPGDLPASSQIERVVAQLFADDGSSTSEGASHKPASSTAKRGV